VATEEEREGVGIARDVSREELGVRGFGGGGVRVVSHP
jgi:hypothetical protein